MSREIKIVTPENVELTFELAGLGSRFVALLLDTLLQGLMLLVLASPFIYLSIYGSGFRFVKNMEPWMFAVLILGLFVITSTYFLYFEATKNGQTPGKKAAGIRVILDTGHPVDFRAAFLRNIMRIVDVLPGMYAIGFISIFFSSEYRRLGDYTAGTLVVRTGKNHQTALDVAREHDKSWYASEPSEQPVGYHLGSNQVFTIGTEVTEPIERPVEVTPSIPQSSLPYLHLVTKDDYRAVRHYLDRRAELEAGVARNLAEKIAVPLAAKLHIEKQDMPDPVVLLDGLAHEWERRMIH